MFLEQNSTMSALLFSEHSGVGELVKRIFAPINRLPNETLLQIFELYAPRISDRDTTMSEPLDDHQDGSDMEQITHIT